MSELTEEKHIQAQSSHIKEKKKFNFKKWLKGNNKQEHIENISITTIIAAAVFLWFGMLLGSFVKYTVLLAVIGCFGLLIGICIYIASQMIEKE